VASSDLLADRMAIEDLVAAYADAVDRRRWDDLDRLFSPDALIDYAATGSIRGTVAELKSHLQAVLPMMLSYQHLMGRTILSLHGDEAEGTTICFNPMVLDTGTDRGPTVFFCGLWYHDRFVRSAGSWLISARTQELSYFHNFPGGLPPGAQPYRSTRQPE